MTKRIKSKFRVCKKIHGLHKNLWGIHKATNFRSTKIFKQKVFLVNQKKNRLTAFGRYLNTKQILKNFYCNISEQNFQKYISKSIVSKAPCLLRFFSLLESRVDIILFRACLVNSLYMGRQLINHNIVFLNDKAISCLTILAKKNDIISLNPKKVYLQSKIAKILKQRRLKQFYQVSIKILEKFNELTSKKVIRCLTYNNRIITSTVHKIFLKKFNSFLNLKKFKSIEQIPKHLEVNFQIFKIVFLWDPRYQKLNYPIKIKYKKHSKTSLLSLNNILYKY